MWCSLFKLNLGKVKGDLMIHISWYVICDVASENEKQNVHKKKKI